MKTDEAWKIQVSYKIGLGNQHLINVRGDDVAEVMESLRGIASNALEILNAANAFSPPSPPAEAPRPTLLVSEPSRPLPAPAQAPPQAQGETLGQEIGPFTVEKVEDSSGVGKTGKPYTRYIATIGGVKANTFDTVLAGAARGLIGKQCYFRATKGAYGYELDTIRSA